MAEKVIMLGNEAIARGAYEAGVKVSSAYPGTPSTEISEYLVQYKDDVYEEWAPNEKVATEVAVGASLAGVRSMACMKHVGLNVAADPLYSVSYMGVNGGLVLVVADDPGLYSSQNEQDTRMVARAAQIPVIEPSDSAEAKDFFKTAFELSEQFDRPFIFRTTTRLAHSQGIVELCDRAQVEDKPYEKNIPKNVMMPGNAKLRHVEIEKRNLELAEAANTLSLNKMEMSVVFAVKHLVLLLHSERSKKRRRRDSSGQKSFEWCLKSCMTFDKRAINFDEKLVALSLWMFL